MSHPGLEIDMTRLLGLMTLLMTLAACGQAGSVDEPAPQPSPSMLPTGELVRCYRASLGNWVCFTEVDHG